MAIENAIQELKTSLEELDEFYKNDQITDAQLKQLCEDAGRLHMLRMDLEKLIEGM